jgi:hypothetical protein
MKFCLWFLFVSFRKFSEKFRLKILKKKKKLKHRLEKVETWKKLVVILHSKWFKKKRKLWIKIWRKREKNEKKEEEKL